ncbi:hypothetical protein ACOL29_07920 [Aliarcobacter butzleri]
MKIIANIMILNEEKNIEEVMKSIKSACDEVLVINISSNNKTCEITESFGEI